MDPEKAAKHPFLSIVYIYSRTLAYAYNGYLNSTIENKQIGNSMCTQFEIKKGKKVIVEGLSKVKELDEKVGIYGF